jgi:Rod binding domain-containing protein
MTNPVTSLAPARLPQPGAVPENRLHQLARDLEANFLAEMLRCAGLDRTSEHFGGGIGERQFASFLAQEQAGAMVRAGGLGLAESLFKALSDGRA